MSTTPARLRLGLIGLNFGRHMLKEISSGSAAPFIELAAVCDLNRAKADQYAAEYHVPAFYDLDALLADPTIPAIGLFTGPVGRAALIRRIIRAGKDVITTKPFERDPAAALAVLQEAAQLKRVVHINSPSPVLPDELRLVQQWQTAHALGRPVACRRDVWVGYREKADGSWYDDPTQCPIPPVFRLGIYLINDLVRLFGEAQRVTALSSRLFTERPTSDNGQLGILFHNGMVVNIFGSFCVTDGDHYRNSMVLNFENGTIYYNAGPVRGATNELSLVQRVGEQRQVVAQANVTSGSGLYQWEAFARAVRGENLGEVVTPAQVVAGLKVIAAMAAADQGNGVAEVV